MSRGTSTIDCRSCRGTDSSSGSAERPITTKISARGSIAPVDHHLRPVTTYSSPSRRIRVAMLVASDEATSGSVMQNADRMVPSSSGASQRSCCSAVPNSASTSMLPVSGAAQFSASGARCGERPVISASGAYCRLRQTGAVLAGQEQVPQPAAARLGLELLDHGGAVPGVPGPAGGLDLLLDHGLGRVHPLGHELLEAGGVLERGGVGGEVHGQSSSDGVASSSSPPRHSGSTRAPIRSNPSPTVCPWVKR